MHAVYSASVIFALLLVIKVQRCYPATMSNSGDDLKALRNTLGMTQEEVAELAGISLRSYKSYENEQIGRASCRERV